MRYIIISDFNDTINICTNEEGETLIFETLEEAQVEANDCQNGIVVPLSTNLFSEEQMLDALVSMDIGLNPENYEESKGLSTEDFPDLALCKAQEFNIEQEFNQACKDAGEISHG